MIKANEIEIIESKLGRKPNKVEYAMFDSMWSEHCSYKSSKHWFKLFSGVTSPRVKLGIGEGAGLVDIGDSQLIGLALESHNHPSAIDPFNGAATGVGGIIRDVISQGCKPIALLDSLRFGSIDLPHNQFLFENVVRGISSYGNCVGIPNIGGDVSFDPSYNTNCLVNAMCIGLINENDVVRSKAENIGDMLIVFGSKTGRDGIGGVSFASEELTENSDEDRPAVQIGDPAQEKILIDIIDELITKKLITAMQDLGGGGFTCATSEIVFTGNRGARIFIDKLPLREEGMEPWEIMISESQERMLVAVKPNNVDSVKNLLEKYEIDYGIIGTVIEEDNYIVEDKDGKILAEIPTSFLVEGFPIYNHKFEEPKEYTNRKKIISDKNKFDYYIKNIFNSPNLASKNFVYDQYDKHVQTRTMVEVGSGAGILDIGFKKAIGAVLDTNDYQVSIDPKIGTIMSVLRNIGRLYASGLEPIAIVDCLNFGNPEKPDSYWQFISSIQGLAEVVKALHLPIVGGNVSLYNENKSDKGNLRINPTPTIGILGLTKDKSKIVKDTVLSENSKLLIIGDTIAELDGTEVINYLEKIHDGMISIQNIEAASINGKVVKELILKKLVNSAKYISRGGIFATIAKMLFNTEFGALLYTSKIPIRESNEPNISEIWFDESAGRFILEINPENENKVTELLDRNNIQYSFIGKTIISEHSIYIDDKRLDLGNIEQQWKNAINSKMIM